MKIRNVFCSLGCGIGYGYLHRIPLRSISESSTKTAFPHLVNPVAAQVSPSAYPNPSIVNPVTSVPPGFTIPQNYAATTAPSDIPREGTNVAMTPVIPTVPTIPTSSVYHVLDPAVAGASTTTNPTGHLFSQPASNYPHSE